MSFLTGQSAFGSVLTGHFGQTCDPPTPLMLSIAILCYPPPWTHPPFQSSRLWGRGREQERSRRQETRVLELQMLWTRLHLLICRMTTVSPYASSLHILSPLSPQTPKGSCDMPILQKKAAGAGGRK